MAPSKPRRLKLPLIECDTEKVGTLHLDNYIIHALFVREDYPEYFTEEERTFEAIVEAARVQREKDEAEFEPEEAARRER